MIIVNRARCRCALRIRALAQGSFPAWRWMKAASVLASWSWFTPKPIRWDSVQNFREKGVGSDRWVLKTWKGRPPGAISFMCAQIRVCFRSFQRST